MKAAFFMFLIAGNGQGVDPGLNERNTFIMNQRAAMQRHTVQLIGRVDPVIQHGFAFIAWGNDFTEYGRKILHILRINANPHIGQVIGTIAISKTHGPVIAMP